jgi:hypothetical protein
MVNWCAQILQFGRSLSGERITAFANPAQQASPAVQAE